MDPTPDWRAFDQPPPRPTAAGPGAPPLAPPRRWLVAGSLAVAALALAGGGLLAASAPQGGVLVESGASPTRPSRSTLPDPSSRSSPAGSVRPSPDSGIVVDVEGAVARPGVYRLSEDSRVADAVAAAGGFDSRVDARAARLKLNLAARLADGDQVRVPSLDDEVASGPSPAVDAAAGGLVDLNRATAAELDALPGIGPVTSAKILAARATQPFSTVDELLSRKLVSASTFEKVRDLVTVGG